MQPNTTGDRLTLANLIPDLAKLVDRYWHSAKPSSFGVADRVQRAYSEQSGVYYRVRIGGNWWAVAPTEDHERTTLELFWQAQP